MYRVKFWAQNNNYWWARSSVWLEHRALNTRVKLLTRRLSSICRRYPGVEGSNPFGLANKHKQLFGKNGKLDKKWVVWP